MAPLYGSSSGNLFMAPPILIKLAARYHNINKGSSIAPNKTHQADGGGTVGPNSKNPPKIKLKRFVKLTDHTCAWNSLTNFDMKCNQSQETGEQYIC